MTEKQKQPSDEHEEKVETAIRNVPGWLRPFLSLRIQLVSAYCIVLILVIMFTEAMLHWDDTSLYTGSIIILAIVMGSLLAFFFTTLLLRPLWRVTDAAQAIALGDLEQRGRLPLRLPPQDEVDRLSGSLNEMVTRLEHAEQMQKAAEQRFQRFFTDASHQLRTPLTSLRGFTDVLLRGAKDDPEVAQRVLKRMKSEAERMTLLINNLLTLARLNDSQPLRTQYMDLAELALESVEHARKRANDNSTVSLVQISLGPLGIQADRERIKQLLFILLDNAIKYGCPAASAAIVTLQLDKQEQQAIIRIIDNGEGMTPEEMVHIFDSFYRGQRPSNNGNFVVGTGLGLTIASAIVHAHHGIITAQSELHKGTEFTVTLPCIR